MLRYLLIFFLLVQPSAVFAKRIALLIGNSDYANVEGVDFAVNDAEIVGEALAAVGYEVEILRNATGLEMRSALRDFSAKSANADVAVYYYSGHGFAANGENFLLPVDASIEPAERAMIESISLKDVIMAGAAANGLPLMIIDVPAALQIDDQRFLSRGLARVEELRKGFLVFSSSAGTVASYDGAGNSAYAIALAEVLRVPGLEVEHMLRRARAAVLARTDGRQVPSQFGVYPLSEVVINEPEESEVTNVASNAGAKLEQRFWEIVRDTDTISGYQDFLAEYPDSVYSQIAARRLAHILAGEQPPTPVNPPIHDPTGSGLPPQPQVGIRASRIFAALEHYPPSDFAAYGIVAFRTGPGRDTSRYEMFCDAFRAALPTSARLARLNVAVSVQMVTVWPINSKSVASELNSKDDAQACKAAAEQYGQVMARQAILDAEFAGAKLEGLGPFLLAWAPARLKGDKSAPVLVTNLSEVEDPSVARKLFADWADKIESDPELWRDSWEEDGIRAWIRDTLDGYGGLVDAALFGN